MTARRHHGAHLGTVTDNADPKGLGRVRAKVPELLDDVATGWCLPSAPFAGKGSGFFAVPPLDSLVFVEWPGGDLTRIPRWTGAAWADGDGIPGASPRSVLIVTPGGHRIELSDESGSEQVVITATSGAKSVLDGAGIVLQHGGQKLAITSSSISINDGALTVR